MSVLAELAKTARYGGNPEHKRNPGDFNLTPPASPRRGKTLCDDLELFSRAEALRLLRIGLERGVVDARWAGDAWPCNVWVVTEAGRPLEAQGDDQGNYHGYPMPAADPFREVVLDRWRAACLAV
jgi:hypothetical protein